MTVSRAFRLRECPLGEFPLYVFSLCFGIILLALLMINLTINAGMNLSNRAQIKNRKTRHFRLVCFLKNWQSLHKSTESQYLKLRDRSKSKGGGGVGRSREGVGHEVLSLVQGVGRAIFSYP